jgi:hypothetical protein
METSTLLSLTALGLSIFAIFQSFIAHKSTIISDIKKELSDKAIDCNRFIIPETQSHPNSNDKVSAIVTAIVYAKNQLKIHYKNHKLLLVTYDQKDLIRYFYFQLHSSIIELIKNPLHISDYDPNTSPKIEAQHLESRKFLQSIIDEN